MNSFVTATAETFNDDSLWSRFLDWLISGAHASLARRTTAYSIAAMISLALIWLPVAGFIALKPPMFVSKWTLILPGSGAGHAVSLESIGQASATASSPFNSRAVDPKVNYKALAESPPVLAAAAARLGIASDQFQKPRVKLTDQTALMEFRVAGTSGQQAYEKSKALYAALQNELERLRNDELAQREQAVNEMLKGFSDKLRQAQEQVLSYQSGAEIVSIEQFTELTLNLERTRNRYRMLAAERASLDGELSAMQDALGLSPHAAAAVLTLQQDSLMRQLVADWAEASSRLTKNSSRWGPKHERVISARDDVRELREEIFKRARLLAPELKRRTETIMAEGVADPTLFRRLIELSARKHGMDRQIEELRRSVEEQKALLERSTADASNLEGLNRKHQVATAVFTTALAKVDIGKSDRFSSYPMVQLLAEPTVPDGPDTLAQNLALLGGGTATFLCLSGLALLWVRKPFLRKLLKSE